MVKKISREIAKQNIYDTLKKRVYIFPQKWNQIKIEQIRAGNLHRPETKKQQNERMSGYLLTFFTFFC